ncbi:MAG: transglutaminase family protein, partial [Candidatus Binatia bacterium]
MAIRVALYHLTRYRYDRLISLSPHVVRLRPAPHCRTPVSAYSLKVRPAQHFVNWQQDPFGNFLARLVFPEKTRELAVEVDLVAEMTVINPFDFFLDPYAEKAPFPYEPQLAKELGPYLEIKENGPHLRQWLANVDRSPRATVDFLVDLNQRLRQDIDYIVRMEPGVQTCEETFARGKGSCRDSGWLLVQILRHLGFAARFVSGYLIQLTADTKALDGPSGPDADFTDLHAWAEVFVPGAGWIGLDPTSGLFAGEGHLPLACTPDPVSAAPVTGFADEGEVDFQFHMNVTRIHEDSRVTKPYTNDQWRAIEALGCAVDNDLVEGDVRLTMGGEPTFVSIDDMDGEEWNTAALGPNKRKSASILLHRLKERFAPGGVLHYGQGKWYPGEPLPRWAFYCFWRQDGVPVWRDPALLAEENTETRHDIKQAYRFIRALAQRLGVSPEHAIPGYEDSVYYLWKEGTLPANVDPLQYNLDDPDERRRLARILDRGLGEVVGYVLPLKWRGETHEGAWCSNQWRFRREHMFLLPGDSPMGYRLPLDSLPWAPSEARDLEPEQSPFASRSALEEVHGEVADRYAQFTRPDPTRHDDMREQILEPVSVEGEDFSDLVRTALCVEPRDGRLHVFLPPLRFVEHYLDLIASLELTAAEFSWPIFIEGYTPPSDWRLRHFSVTPDPGVIEVNIQPAQNWEEVVTCTTVLYEEARLARLGTEKFMHDGRHTGTGGGNHVTLGGSTPADSPFLRRPELLQSLLTYWQHHPSLSYLFSGLFVGPTSQAPRVDEARHESLYELEIAFQQTSSGETVAP